MQICASVVLALMLVAAHTASAQGLEGVWRGRVEDRHHRPVDFELEIAPLGAEPAGRLQALGRGSANPFFIDAATVSREGAARIEIRTLRVVIEGQLASAGQSISGAWTQFGSDRQIVNLTRVPSATPRPLFDPLVEIRIPKAPTAVRTDGAYRLYYEIHFSNFTDAHIELKSVDIRIGERTTTVSGDVLARQAVSYGVSIPPGKSGGALIGLGMSSPPPDVLRHRVTFSSAGRTSTLEVQALPVGRNPVRISAPLRGGDWWAGNGPDSSLHHRAAVVPMDGRFTIA